MAKSFVSIMCVRPESSEGFYRQWVELFLIIIFELQNYNRKEDCLYHDIWI
jgi:hypothetical protein